jgi:threonine/homoserine/homoserine lactone efflux protein
MSEAATFFLGAVAVLATPGPTNTLLATSGAISGFRRSLPLLDGELGGYLLAIVVLLSLVGPIVAAMPAFGLVLRIVVCLYLLYLAAMLWRQSGLPIADARPIGPLRVFVTTLLNPKAIIFAFTLLPLGQSDGLVAALPRLGALSVLIVLIGTCWIAAGSSLQRGYHGIAKPRVGYRAGAVALVLVAALVSGNAIGMAWS